MLAVVLASGATSAFDGGLAPASSAAARCFPASSRVLLKDYVAAIAYTPDGLMACDYRVRNPQLVDSPYNTIFAFRGPSLALNGSFVGLAVDDYQKPTCETQVAQVNLADRGGADQPDFRPSQPASHMSRWGACALAATAI